MALRSPATPQQSKLLRNIQAKIDRLIREPWFRGDNAGAYVDTNAGAVYVRDGDSVPLAEVHVCVVEHVASVNALLERLRAALRCSDVDFTEATMPNGARQLRIVAPLTAGVPDDPALDGPNFWVAYFGDVGRLSWLFTSLVAVLFVLAAYGTFAYGARPDGSPAADALLGLLGLSSSPPSRK